MISAIAIKDRLKNQAKVAGRTIQDELVTYGLERTIYRLSISEYAERFTLKGGIFLYALFDGNFARATMDIKILNVSGIKTQKSGFEYLCIVWDYMKKKQN